MFSLLVISSESSGVEAHLWQVHIDLIKRWSATRLVPKCLTAGLSWVFNNVCACNEYHVMSPTKCQKSRCHQDSTQNISYHVISESSWARWLMCCLAFHRSFLNTLDFFVSLSWQHLCIDPRSPRNAPEMFSLQSSAFMCEGACLVSLQRISSWVWCFYFFHTLYLSICLWKCMQTVHTQSNTRPLQLINTLPQAFCFASEEII